MRYMEFLIFSFPACPCARGLFASSAREPTGAGMGIAIVHVRHLFRRVVGIVRPGKAHPRGKGLFAVARQPVGCLVSDKAIYVETLRQRRYRGVQGIEVARVLGGVRTLVAVGAEKLAIVVGQVRMPLVFGANALLEAVARIPGKEVHLADRGSVIPRVGEHLGPDGNLALIEPVRVAQHAGCCRPLPAQQRRARGYTERRGHVAALEHHPLPRQPVEIGRLHEVQTIARQAIPALLVCGDEEKIHECSSVLSLLFYSVWVFLRISPGFLSKWAAAIVNAVAQEIPLCTVAGAVRLG